jgi:cytochrome c
VTTSATTPDRTEAFRIGLRAEHSNEFANMHRHALLHIATGLLVAVVALLLIRLHNAGGATPAADSITAGHKLAEAWCKSCHRIDASAARTESVAPDFVALAAMPSTTELSLKVFLQSNHRSMPNLMLTPDQSGDIVNYILSLKRD